MRAKLNSSIMAAITIFKNVENLKTSDKTFLQTHFEWRFLKKLFRHLVILPKHLSF
jgi:hypothetical protein